MNAPTQKQIEDTLSGTATPEEAKAVARWFSTDEGAACLSELFDKEAAAVKPGDEDCLAGHVIPTEKMLERINKQVFRRQVRRIVFRAAAVLLPFVLLLGLYFQLDSRVDLFGDAGYEDIYVPKGERLQMMFQDGTKAYINSDSHLRYPRQFGLGKREVELQGEAYFVVAKNEKRPFVVHLGGPSIQVVGTSFDVQAYPDNEEIAVCLDEGKINMKLHDRHEIPLHPGERLIYHKRTGQCTVKHDEDTAFSSLWKQNVIAFKDTPFSEVAVKLSRWYNVSFEMAADVPDGLLITLSTEHTILEKVLGDLEKIAPLSFDYDEVNKKVKVSADY